MIKHAKVDGQIEEVIPHLLDGGLSIIQYADDTILFMEHDYKKERNLKLILAPLEQLLGLKINESCLAVGRASFLSSIWGYSFTIRDSQLPNRN
jgi:hypothetical protein